MSESIAILAAAACAAKKGGEKNSAVMLRMHASPDSSAACLRNGKAAVDAWKVLQRGGEWWQRYKQMSDQQCVRVECHELRTHKCNSVVFVSTV